MFEGSCCCGAVRFSVSRSPRMAAECHCTRCRKVGGTPFALVDADSVEIVSGREHIATYLPEPSFKYKRCFCERCGSSLGEILSEWDVLPVPLNVFDQDPGVPIRFHEHVASKGSWAVIPDGVKQFEGDPG